MTTPPDIETNIENDVCPICRESFSETEPSITTPCRHKFHFGCFLNMTRRSPLCALCRQRLVPEDNGTNDDEEVEEGEIHEELVEMTMEQLTNSILSIVGTRITESNGPQEIEISEEDQTYIETRRVEYSLFLACENGNLSEVRSIIQTNSSEDIVNSEDDECNTLVHSASLSNNEALMRYLLVDIGLNVNSHNIYRMSPLHISTMSKHKDMTRILLNHGAFVDQQDSSGRTPLIISAQKNDTDACNLLLDHGASVKNFDSNGDTALHHACRGRCASVIRILVSIDAINVDSPNFFGETPLHIACSNGSTTCIRLLLQNDANCSVKNKAGKKPIDEVSQRDTNRVRITSILREYS